MSDLFNRLAGIEDPEKLKKTILSEKPQRSQVTPAQELMLGATPALVGMVSGSPGAAAAGFNIGGDYLIGQQDKRDKALATENAGLQKLKEAILKQKMGTDKKSLPKPIYKTVRGPDNKPMLMKDSGEGLRDTGYEAMTASQNLDLLSMIRKQDQDIKRPEEYRKDKVELQKDYMKNSLSTREALDSLDQAMKGMESNNPLAIKTALTTIQKMAEGGRMTNEDRVFYNNEVSYLEQIQRFFEEQKDNKLSPEIRRRAAEMIAESQNRILRRHADYKKGLSSQLSQSYPKASVGDVETAFSDLIDAKPYDLKERGYQEDPSDIKSPLSASGNIIKTRQGVMAPDPSGKMVEITSERLEKLLKNPDYKAFYDKRMNK